MALKPTSDARPPARARGARRVGGRGARDAAGGVSRGEAGPGAGLGGSSKYSSENLED